LQESTAFFDSIVQDHMLQANKDDVDMSTNMRLLSTLKRCIKHRRAMRKIQDFPPINWGDAF